MNSNMPYTAEQIVSSIQSNPANIGAFVQLTENYHGYSTGKSILNDNTPKPYFELISIVCDYLNPASYPLIIGDERKKWFEKRLDKFSTKYID